jgi:acetyl esterase/lipase
VAAILPWSALQQRRQCRLLAKQSHQESVPVHQKHNRNQTSPPLISNPSPAVDLELAPLIASTPAFELSLDRLATARADTVEMFRGLAPSPADPEIVVLSGPDAQKVELRVYRPPGDEIRPAIYYIHGGGFVLGTAAMRDGLNWQLAYDS